jgi:hypothetical protein
MSLTKLALMGVWAFACSLLCGALLAFHEVPLPRSLDEAATADLAAAIAAHDGPGERGRWHTIHVMYQRCRCSQRIIDHLTSSARPQGISERVLLVDGTNETKERLARAGFRVDEETATSLHDAWKIEAAPLFIVVDPSGAVRYAGGYTREKQGPAISDLDILAQLRGGASVAALPLFGCAVSRELQAMIDPLGLKRVLAWSPFATESAPPTSITRETPR